MADSNGAIAGYLVINVLEAAGHDSDDAVVWEPEFNKGYARGALGSGAAHPAIPRQPRGAGSGVAAAAAGGTGRPSAAHTPIARHPPVVMRSGDPWRRQDDPGAWSAADANLPCCSAGGG